MVKKKSTSADLEGKRKSFFVMGLVVALSVVLFSFEWGSRKVAVNYVNSEIGNNIIEEMVPITFRKPEPKKILLANNIKITKDKEKDIEIISTEVNENTSIDFSNNFFEEIPVKDIEEPASDDPFIIVEEMPKFPGGDEGRLKYLRSNIKYPELARQIGIKGIVYVQFVIGKDGSVEDVALARGIGSGCDEEALRVVKMMPKWAPGKQRNKPVRVLCTIPINFQLK